MFDWWVGLFYIVYNKTTLSARTAKLACESKLYSVYLYFKLLSVSAIN